MTYYDRDLAKIVRFIMLATRLRYGLSQNEFCSLLGCTQEQISRMENVGSHPDKTVDLTYWSITSELFHLDSNIHNYDRPRLKEIYESHRKVVDNINGRSEKKLMTLLEEAIAASKRIKNHSNKKAKLLFKALEQKTKTLKPLT